MARLGLLAACMYLLLPIAHTLPTPSRVDDNPPSTSASRLAPAHDSHGDTHHGLPFIPSGHLHQGSRYSLGQSFHGPDRLSVKLRNIISNPDAKERVPNSYIVVYKSDYDEDAITSKEAEFAASLARRNLNKRSDAGIPLSTAINAFRIHSWRAAALDADDDMIQSIYDSDEVESVEANVRMSTKDVIQQNYAQSGLARLSHQNTADLDHYVYDASAGEGITVYVVDTGIRVSHEDFQGRAAWGTSFVNEDTDENGHGTHVAGTVGGATFGVAKKVNLVAVQVLDKTGGGTTGTVLSGLNWVHDQVIGKRQGGKAVVNMSLGGSANSGTNSALNNAVNALADAGAVPVVAAGNDNEDASSSSPASASRAITVGAIDAATDEKASFSNYGRKVDVFAPGVNVKSCGIQSDTDTQVMSGTSMATPHIAGMSAYFLGQWSNNRGWQQNPTSQVRKSIAALADRSGARVVNNAQDTTYRIANNGNQ